MKPSKRKYGYGIINCRGEVFWDESCVCEHRGPLLDQVKEMNYDEGDGAPFKVIALYFFSKAKRRDTTQGPSAPQKEE